MAKSRSLNSIFPKKSKSKAFKADSYTTQDLADFLNTELDDESGAITVITSELCVCAVMITMLVQLKLSTTEPSQHFDQLSSTRYYKKRIICGDPGLVWTTMIAAYETFDLLGVPLSDLLETYIHEAILPTKKFTGKPNKNNAVEYFKHRRAQILGTLQACPSTKPSYFNLDPSCIDWDVKQTLDYMFPKGIPPGITVEDITNSFCEHILTKENGPKLEEVIFNEANNLSSKIETQVLGKIIKRTGEISNTIQQNGKLPDNKVTQEILEQFLTPKELRQYKVALKFNDKTIIKRLTEVAKQKSIESAK